MRKLYAHVYTSVCCVRCAHPHICRNAHHTYVDDPFTIVKSIRATNTYTHEYTRILMWELSYKQLVCCTVVCHLWINRDDADREPSVGEHTHYSLVFKSIARSEGIFYVRMAYVSGLKECLQRKHTLKRGQSATSNFHSNVRKTVWAPPVHGFHSFMCRHAVCVMFSMNKYIKWMCTVHTAQEARAAQIYGNRSHEINVIILFGILFI